VAAWLPGSEGEGVADVLFRRVAATQHDFTGRLSFSWPETAMPVAFDAAERVSGALFPRGFGLDYQAIADSPRLAEDPRIPAARLAGSGSLFHAGHVTAPWSLFVADDGAEVHLTTTRQESPSGAVVATADPDGVSAVWAGERGMIRISGRASDLRRQAGLGTTLDVRYRVDRTPAHSVRIGMRCAEPLCGTRGGAMLDVTQLFANSRQGTWRTLTIPLSCFTAAAADLSSVDVPFAVETSGRFGLTISEVGLTKRSSAAPVCPGSILNARTEANR
jgi:beta-glucosidase